MAVRIASALLVVCLALGCTNGRGKNGELLPKGAPGWLELYDLSFHPQSEAVTPQGLYIQGYMAAEKDFTPTSGIKGQAIFEAPTSGTTPGWVQLNGLKFIRDVVAVSPTKPYVKGVQDQGGKFYPNKPYEIVGGPGSEVP